MARRFAVSLAISLAPWLAYSADAHAADPSADARRLYAEGKAEYAQGHYEQAIALFEQSYSLSESPALLFNMAQAHRLAGPTHCADARKLYQSYLEAFPDAENRREVEERIKELGTCPEAPPAAAPQPTPPPAASAAAPVKPTIQVVRVMQPAPRGLPPGPVITTGAGAAILVAGGVLYWRAFEKHREAQKICPCYPGTFNDWEMLTNVSYALLGLGAAATATGVSWWFIGQPAAQGNPAQALLGVSGRF
jgi:tetratricopeptide (TPR) repeat protein